MDLEPFVLLLLLLVVGVLEEGVLEEEEGSIILEEEVLIEVLLGIPVRVPRVLLLTVIRPAIDITISVLISLAV